MKGSLAFVALLAVATVSVAFYLLPVLIGWIRRVPDLGMVAVIDLFLGWIFVGWVLALALAMRSVRRAGPTVHVVQHYQEQPDACGQTAWAGRPDVQLRTDPAPPLCLPEHPPAWPNVAGWSPWAAKGDEQP